MDLARITLCARASREVQIQWYIIHVETLVRLVICVRDDGVPTREPANAADGPDPRT